MFGLLFVGFVLIVFFVVLVYYVGVVVLVLVVLGFAFDAFCLWVVGVVVVGGVVCFLGTV